MSCECEKRKINDMLQGTRQTVTLMLLAIVLFVSPLKASIVNIGLKGKVTEINDYVANLLEGQIAVGDEISGNYKYNSEARDHNPSNSVGGYSHYEAPYGFFLNVGGFRFETDLDNVDFLVAVGDNSYGDDHYLLRSYSNLPFLNDVVIEQISWELDDFSAKALSSDALPLDAPSLEDWSLVSPLYVDGNIDGGCSGLILAAEVTDVWLIPEPGTLALLGFGGLAVLRRRRR